MERVYVLLLVELGGLIVGIPLYFLLGFHKQITTHNSEEHSTKEHKDMSINKLIRIWHLRKHFCDIHPIHKINQGDYKAEDGIKATKDLSENSHRGIIKRS